MGILYLEIEDIIDAYAVVLECSAERAWIDLRDRGRLEAALARPGVYAFYRGADLVLQGAALVHGIAEGQPFLDGNKRTAHVAMTAFLFINGFELDLSIERELADWILRLSEELTVGEFADLLRPWLLPVR